MEKNAYIKINPPSSDYGGTDPFASDLSGTDWARGAGNACKIGAPEGMAPSPLPFDFSVESERLSEVAEGFARSIVEQTRSTPFGGEREVQWERTDILKGGHRAHWTSYQRWTERLELAAFSGMALVGVSVILLATVNAMRFGANEEVIVSGFSSQEQSEVGTNVSAGAVTAPDGDGAGRSEAVGPGI